MPFEQPPASEVIERAVVELGGKLCWSRDTHYVVVEIAPGEFASILEREDGYSIHWPWGRTERRRFDCPDLVHVRNVLADLLATPYPKFRDGV